MNDPELAALLIYWREFPAPSNEVFAVEIIERLQCQLAAANAANAALRWSRDPVNWNVALIPQEHSAAIERAEKARGK